MSETITGLLYTEMYWPSEIAGRFSHLKGTKENTEGNQKGERRKGGWVDKEKQTPPSPSSPPPPPPSHSRPFVRLAGGGGGGTIPDPV